jgi:hypothetical protein
MVVSAEAPSATPRTERLENISEAAEMVDVTDTAKLQVREGKTTPSCKRV